jgi:acyl carrier protein
MTDINGVIADVLGLPESEVNDLMTRQDVPSWDSLNHLRLITALEQECGVSFAMEEIVSIESIANLRHLVEQKRATE